MPFLCLSADKHGCCPEECLELVQRISEDCKHLMFCGLMTIGRPRQHHSGQNPDFQVPSACMVDSQHLYIATLSFVVMPLSIPCMHVKNNKHDLHCVCIVYLLPLPSQTLLQCSVEVQKPLGSTQPLELSMGMSADFQHAVSESSVCHFQKSSLPLFRLSSSLPRRPLPHLDLSQIQMGSTNLRIGTALFGPRD